MILILGGTSEARELTLLCVQHDIPVIYSSTTRIWDEIAPTVECRVGKLCSKELQDLIQDRGILGVVDATHPFAVKISQLAMDVCSHTGTAYLRLERATITQAPWGTHVKQFSTVEKAGAYACKTPGAILSAIGVRKLPELVAQLGNRKDDLFARVLPVIDSLAICDRLGICPSHVVGMRGPFSAEFDALLIQKLGVKTMIAKESGDRGGLSAKLTACKNTGCKLLLVTRPAMQYPRQVSEPIQCMTWINACLGE